MPLRSARRKISSGSSVPSMCRCSSAFGMERSSAGRRERGMASKSIGGMACLQAFDAPTLARPGRWAGSVSVDRTAVPDAQHENHEPRILDAGDDAVVADPVLPEAAQRVAARRLANGARIAQPDKALAQE